LYKLFLVPFAGGPPKKKPPEDGLFRRARGIKQQPSFIMPYQNTSAQISAQAMQTVKDGHSAVAVRVASRHGCAFYVWSAYPPAACRRTLDTAPAAG
jgi:hypothetical protein